MQPSSTTGDQSKDDGSILGDAGKEGEKPADEKPEGEKPEPKPEDEKPNALLGAPEGDYEITGLPEGVTIDKPVLDALAPIAKKIGISNEGMSKLAASYNDTILPHVVEQVQAGLTAQIDEIKRGWDSDTRKAIAEDPKFDGKPYGEVTQIAAKALDRLGGEGLRKALTDSGFGNHPAMVEFAYRAGKAIAEDNFDRGDGVAAEKPSLQTALYGQK